MDNQKTVEHENDIKVIVNCVQRIYKWVAFPIFQWVLLYLNLSICKDK